MNLSAADELVLAHFLATQASSVTVDGRFYPRQDFVRIFEDRLAFAPRPPVSAKIEFANIASVLVDKLIQEGALSTVNDQWTGVSHQFKTDRYKSVIKELNAANDICQQAARAGSTFWEKAFESLSQDATAR